MPGDCSALHTPCMHQANTCRNACNRDRSQQQMHAPDCSTASSHLSISTHKHKRVYLRQHLHIHTSTYVYIHTHLHIHTCTNVLYVCRISSRNRCDSCFHLCVCRQTRRALRDKYPDTHRYCWRQYGVLRILTSHHSIS